ncbi:hypothetical protein [Listeria seeligeri]|uniref:Uncharacterized protein n=1 Tax=Listeria seeligeri TaxID=1640 RepID=A0A7X1C7B0_LISSE|nr:hypothetical protein [Listeria seeligeri]MBC1487051.1 hypothetical protein [Listeria seeligeri]MBC1934368.1 hypothetical protein [Listeria seeligeri]MBF2373461.1 hypothetical protein [Listeria seeligeri]MBF2544938.1 hypothetical protein [Listeria seeligeri]MBF2641678.1 hypothetical protein [Listeria seeligeri]
MEKLDFTYKDANYNAEFLIKILLILKDITKTEQFEIRLIEAVPNDQEEFMEEKGLFSQEVFDFNNLVRESHGIQVDFNKIVSILKQCRTVWEFSMSAVISDNEWIKVNLIEGDLFTIVHNEDNNIKSLLANFINNNEIIIEE